jgi:hypothetical protein
MNNLKFKDLLVEHDYYCSTSNYDNHASEEQWETWSDFYEEYKDEDIDRNLVFRWDIQVNEETGKYYMKVFMIRQRQGQFAPHYIKQVDEKDLKTIKEFLSKPIRFQKPYRSLNHHF